MNTRVFASRTARVVFMIATLTAASCGEGVVFTPPDVPPVLPPVAPGPTVPTTTPTCARTVHASVVALDQVMMANRLGTSRPGGMMFALERDIVPSDPTSGVAFPTAGNVRLRPDKRPRPIVLRANMGDCLELKLTNLVAPGKPGGLRALQPVTRQTSIHIAGMELRDSILSDGTLVGANDSGLVDPGDHRTYRLYAAREGNYFLYSGVPTYNGFNPEQVTMGLFGSLVVETRTAEWYRSQVTAADLLLAQKRDASGKPLSTPDGHPILDYGAHYPPDAPGGRACTPILRMLDVAYVAAGEAGKRRCEPASGEAGTALRLYHTDLTAIITGPKAGRFPESEAGPGFTPNPATPDRHQPFREVAIHYHESQDVIQPFPDFYQATPYQDLPTRDKTAPPLPSGNGLNPAYTLAAGGDGFGINYGVAGIGPEIMANRLKVGPSTKCKECKFEEFFLTSWAVGDPAMLVDHPANETAALSGQALTEKLLEMSETPPTDGKSPVPEPDKSYKATKAFYPDDPSNVYHAYLGDHVKFRIAHAGAAVHHVHHHHAHQWLKTPDSDEGHYLDSQSIGPGATFSLELVYGGAGNRNKTAGDSIFHCHFYPHFAAGMWGLFRVHDVFEAGTALDGDGRAVPGARALPDAEISNGTPIPGVVPLPTIAMAPIPAPFVFGEDGRVVVKGEGSPGFPFFVPGIPGHRPPHPPMDFAVDKGVVLNGGLPRHVVLDATVSNEKHNYYDFSKDLSEITAMEVPEPGTRAEQAAMAAHSRRHHDSFTPEGAPAKFTMTGLPPQPGAPFADPGGTDDGKAVTGFRRYKGANIQVDAVFNKKGWHFPQQRMIALWGDVADTLNGKKPPEPLFFRANSGEVVEYWHANLVPSYYELDDFQVRTPTDILGQHIHLVKFDVTSSDGAANGFNYEDGTFAPDEVQGRIWAITAGKGLRPYQEPSSQKGSAQKILAQKGIGLSARTIPELDPTGRWPGAQATVQRWWVDPLLDAKGDDRTITTVFTHDHFSPSTHQQAGLYGGLLAEPKGSTWTSLDGKVQLGQRVAGRIDDGGPTSYAANILLAGGKDGYREFAMAMQDMQLAYFPGSRAGLSSYRPECLSRPSRKTCLIDPPTSAYLGYSDPNNVINPPCQGAAFTSTTTPQGSPFCVVSSTNPTAQAQPQIISVFGNGIFSVNYRGEPLPLRVSGTSTSPETAAATDLAQAFRSIHRLDPAFDSQPTPGAKVAPGASAAFPVQPISAGMEPEDPYTPLLQAYANDKVQVRVLAGAHTSMHDFTIHGVKWLAEPGSPNSGYRNSQFVVLSEHFEMNFTVPPQSPELAVSDYLYSPSTSYEGLVNGIWGILRAHDGGQGKNLRADLAALPNNPKGSAPPGATVALPGGALPGCNQGKPGLCEFRISAVTAATALGSKEGLVYNGRGIMVSGAKGEMIPAPEAPLVDPNALVYVRDEDLDDQGRLKAERQGVLEPLVIRVAAGDWIKVTLRNRLTGSEPVFQQPSCEPAAKVTVPFSNAYSNVTLCASKNVGLHPQLVAFDVAQSNGINVGKNPVKTAPPQGKVEVLWYAGDLTPKADGGMTPTPMELGAVNLMPADPLVHFYHGLFGAMVVEPAGSTWVEDTDYRASATVRKQDGSVFRDFVLQVTDDAAVRLSGQSLYAAGNPMSGVNYRTEPMFYRQGQRLDKAVSPAPADWRHLTAADEGAIAGINWSGVDSHLSTANALVQADPETPIFRAPAGMPVRFRLVAPGGTGDNQQVFELTGHVWQDEPYTKNSTEIGHNPQASFQGVQGGYGPSAHYDVVLPSAGGSYRVPGDYYYRSWPVEQLQAGLWGIFRVAPTRAGEPFPDTVTISKVAPVASGGTVVHGVITVLPGTTTYARKVNVTAGGATQEAAVSMTGRWRVVLPGAAPAQITVVSEGRGTASYQRHYDASAKEAPPGKAPPARKGPNARHRRVP